MVARPESCYLEWVNEHVCLTSPDTSSRERDAPSSADGVRISTVCYCLWVDRAAGSGLINCRHYRWKRSSSFVASSCFVSGAVVRRDAHELRTGLWNNEHRRLGTGACLQSETDAETLMAS